MFAFAKSYTIVVGYVDVVLYFNGYVSMKNILYPIVGWIVYPNDLGTKTMEVYFCVECRML